MKRLTGEQKVNGRQQVMVSLIITRFVYRPFLARVLLLVISGAVVAVAIDIVVFVVARSNKQMAKVRELTIVIILAR